MIRKVFLEEMYSPARSVFIRTPFSSLYLTVATLMEKITGPLSTGSRRLTSTDVRVNPDVEKCVNGIRNRCAEEPVHGGFYVL